MERIFSPTSGQVYSFYKLLKLKMVVITQPPKGPKELAFEKKDPNLIGGLPPIHFVNYRPKKPAGEKLSFVKITFSKSVTENYEMFVTGNTELTIKLVMVHKTM